MSNRTRSYEGQLEVNHTRGVIYFHCRAGITRLRICRLPKPIPADVCIDITHMHGASYVDNEIDRKKK